MKSTARRDKVQLTLGELYRRMSAEFRSIRPSDHAACVMPMVVAADNEDGRNWNVEPLSSFCPFCGSLTQMIVAQFATQYRVRYFPQPSRTAEPFFAGYHYAAD